MNYREYKNQDYGSIIRLIKSAWDERNVYDAVDYQLIDPFWYEDHIFNNPEYITIVAIDRTGSVKGWITGKVYSNEVQIKMLFIARDVRGSGHGANLKRLLTGQARSLGKDRIVTFNRYDNEGSLKLNHKLGWTIFKINEDYYRAEYNFRNKTIQEWEAIAGIQILDPDGFDRTDEYLHQRRFSEEEFKDKVMTCSIQVFNMDKWNTFIDTKLLKENNNEG